METVETLVGPGLSERRLEHMKTKPGKWLTALATSRHHLTPHFCFLNSAIPDPIQPLP